MKAHYKITPQWIKQTLLCFIALFTLSGFAQHKLSIEAASPDPTLIVRGPEYPIISVNATNWANNEGINLLTQEFAKQIENSKTTLVAVLVDAQMNIIEVVNKAPAKGQKPAFNQAINLSIPKGGFALIAVDDNYSEKNIKRFLAENFQKGDVVKLRINGEVANLSKITPLASAQAMPSLNLNGETMRTILKPQEIITGSINNFKRGEKYVLEAFKGEQKTSLKVNAKGTFSGAVNLSQGVNYLDIVLSANGKELHKEHLILFVKQNNTKSSEVVLWVEQFPNAKVLTTDEAIRTMVENAKKAGFTSIGFDVKGPEGYVSYRKNALSRTPYFTNSINPKKQVADNGFDLLDAILKEAHAQNLKVYVSFNFFTEGNLTAQDFAVLNNHRHWEEIVQRPEDKGQLLAVRDSKIGKEAAEGKRVALAFVNPALKEVQDFQLLRVEEVLQNYPIDGIVLDRCRYDNLYADFSHTSRNMFAEYLTKKEKRLEQFPADAFLINEEGELIQGKHYAEWITFRSMIIKEFTDRVRSLVNKYKAEKNPNLKLAAYVGSWYEVYYQNGVNWASKNFRYDSRLNFPESKIYTPEYYTTSYLENLDFLMIGTYYKTGKEVNKYITLGNILTNAEVPIMGSMSLPDLKNEEQAEVFKASLNTSDGLMIFDFCYIDWETFLPNMKKAQQK